jgi:hypothetical protein
MTRSDAACLTIQTHEYQNGRGVCAGEERQTFLGHSALRSAPSRSLPVTPAGGCAPLGYHAARTRTLAPAPSERAGPSKDRGQDGAARRAPCLACLRVILSPSQDSPAPQPRGDAQAKMCFIFLMRRSGSPGRVLSICRGLLDPSTTDAKALRASAGWRAKERV